MGQPNSSWPPAFLVVLPFFAAWLASTAGSRADIIYVSNWNNRTIQKFDSVTGNDLGYLASDLSGGPRGLALDRAGNLYAVIWGSQSIMKYTPEGVGSVFATGLQGPESLAFDSAGNLYVGEQANNTIRRFTPDGIGSVFASSGLDEPNGLAFDQAGNLYVANSHANTIQKITPEGLGSVFAAGLNHPYGLAFDKAGDLFVANYWGPYYGGPSIQKFTPEGVGSVFATGLADPAGLAFDNAGNLYVADQWGGANNGSLVEFSPAGVNSVFANIYYGGPLAIAIQVVPEPSATALLGLALSALVGGRWRKTRANKAAPSKAGIASRFAIERH